MKRDLPTNTNSAAGHGWAWLGRARRGTARQGQ